MRVRASITGPEPAPRFAARTPDDLDRLTATLHGRRSRMAEGDRLAGLCRVRTLPELARTVFPGSEPEGIEGFQRSFIDRLIRELSELIAHMSGPSARLLYWPLVRFQVENLKVLIRMRSSGRALEGTDDYLIPLPPNLALDVQGLLAAETTDDFVRLTPKGLFRLSLERAVETHGDRQSPFFLEAVLDREYLGALLALVEKFREEDRNHMLPMCRQEADIFHLMAVLRGKFHYGLDDALLLALHVPGTRISRTLFARMLKEQDARGAVERAAGSVFDVPPPEPAKPDGHSAAQVDAAALERLAWNRYAHLSNLAFRQSHLRLGAVLGYTGLRRVEVANLITLSEGVRKGLSPEAIGARMIAYRSTEAPHV